MGVTVTGVSPEEMCDMMCDNVLPTEKKEKERWWIFTFGVGMKHSYKYVKIWGTREGAREKMFERYGKQWAFQYTPDDYFSWYEDHPWVKRDELLEVIR